MFNNNLSTISFDNTNEFTIKSGKDADLKFSITFYLADIKRFTLSNSDDDAIKLTLMLNDGVELTFKLTAHHSLSFLSLYTRWYQIC